MIRWLAPPFFSLVAASMVHQELANRIIEQHRVIEKNDAEIARLQAVVADVDALKRQRDELGARAERIERMLSLRRGPACFVDALAQALANSGVRLVDLREQGGHATLRVLANDNTLISDLMHALQVGDVPGVSDVQLSWKDPWSTSVTHAYPGLVNFRVDYARACP